MKDLPPTVSPTGRWKGLSIKETGEASQRLSDVVVISLCQKRKEITQTRVRQTQRWAEREGDGEKETLNTVVNSEFRAKLGKNAKQVGAALV